MSLTGVISRFATGTYTVTRAGSGSYVNGYYQAAASTTLTITACVQPISGRELKALPEGQRGDELRQLFTTTQLFTRDDSNAPDRVIIDGAVWEVFKVERWQAFGLTHYECVLSRITLQGAAGTVDATLGALTTTAAGTVV